MPILAAIAPPLRVDRWFNTPQALILDKLRSKVVVLHAFRMLCPGGVSHGLPRATKTHELFEGRDVVVIGLHTVFEHHPVMNAAALEAFIHKYRLTFPIGTDKAGGASPVPLTVQAFGLRGTPSVVLIDRGGAVSLNHFGRTDDMVLGAMIGRAVAEAPARVDADRRDSGACGSDGCALR